ncbi:MAG: NUDIX domain-containing protein [Verrucomicrobiota bacterium]
MPTKPFRLAVKAVILDEQGRCLLIRRSAHNRNFVGRWQWPGGKVDAGEDFATALTREVMEETNLQVEITGLAGATHFEMPAVHVILLCLEARLAGGELKLSEEHDEAGWTPLAELRRLELADQVRPFMLDYVARKGAQT